MNPLHARLAALRRRLRLIVTFRGFCWSLSVILLAFCLAALLDWRFHLPSLVRAVLLILTLSGAGVVAYIALLRPLWVRTDNLALALRIEELYPHLNDSLASAIQFLEQSKRGASSNFESSALRLEAVRRTMRQVESVDFSRAISSRGLGLASLCFIFAVVPALVFLLANPAAAFTALERLANPFGGRDWPHQTKILEIQFKERVARGEPFTIKAKVEGMVPGYAQIMFDGVTPAEQAYPLRRSKEGTQGEMVARLDHVERSFRFQIQVNDAYTDWKQVTVQPPPVLVPLSNGRASPQVTLRYPGYTDLPPQELPDGNGNVEAVVGTQLSLRAAVDRPIARAWVEYHPEQPLVNLAAFVSFLGADDTSGLLTRSAAASEVWERIPARLENGNRELTVQFIPRVRGMYALYFEDETGLGNSRLFDLRLQPDPAPTVTLERPSPQRDTLSLLPEAEVTVQLAAQDVQYAVRSSFLTYRTRKAEGREASSPTRLPLYDHQTIGTGLPRMLALMAPQPAPLVRPMRLRPQRVQNSFRLPLSRLQHPDGSRLREGDLVILQGCGDDFDDVNPFKEAGHSAEIELHIVSRGKLDEILNRNQTQIQEELLRLHKEQQEALDKVIRAEQQWRNTGKLKPEDVEQLLQAEQIQQQIKNRIGAKKDEGLRGEVERVREALRDNQLPRAGVHDRMDTVARELERLSREHLEQIEQRLTNARQENEARNRPDPANPGDKKPPKPPEKNEKGDLGEARQHQEKVENALNELLRQLEPWGSINSVKGETRAVLEEQRRLKDEAQKIDKDDTKGREREALTPDEKAALDRVAEMQRRLEERTGQLLDKIQRAAEERKDKEPELTEALKEAFKKGNEGGVQQQMRDATRNIRENKLGEAGKSQKGGMKALEDMVNSLDERREEELDRLRKKMNEAEDKIDEITKEQDELRKKVKEARQIADPQKREKELKRLAEQQAKLQKKTEETARELKRLRAERAAKALEGAAGEMQRAGKKLQDRDDADEQQQEALKRLNEAQEKLGQEQDKVEEELAREKLAKIADQIKLLKERQEAAIAEANRLQEKALFKKRWDRAELFSLGDLAEAQQALARDTRLLVDGAQDNEDKLGAKDEKKHQGKLGGTPVFARVLSRAAQAMEKAGQRMKDFRKNPGEKLTDAEAGKLQREALHRLDQLLDSLKSDKGGVAAKPKDGAGQGGGQGGGQGARPSQDGIPELAQLKVLRSLQKEVNERTETFGRNHPMIDKLNPEEQRELLDLKKEQEEVANLLDDLTAPADEPEGEKK